jgi:hypothetical protein
VRALIRYSTNFFTWPGVMLATCTFSTSHDNSCFACHLTMSCKSTKSSGEPNSGRLMSFISQLIFSQISHTRPTFPVYFVEVPGPYLPSIRLPSWFQRCYYPITLRCHAISCLDPSILHWYNWFTPYLGMPSHTISPHRYRFLAPWECLLENWLRT